MVYDCVNDLLQVGILQRQQHVKKRENGTEIVNQQKTFIFRNSSCCNFRFHGCKYHFCSFGCMTASWTKGLRHYDVPFPSLHTIITIVANTTTAYIESVYVLKDMIVKYNLYDC